MGTITIRSGSQSITLLDRNLWAEDIFDNGLYFQRGKNVGFVPETYHVYRKPVEEEIAEEPVEELVEELMNTISNDVVTFCNNLKIVIKEQQ